MNRILNKNLNKTFMQKYPKFIFHQLEPTAAQARKPYRMLVIILVLPRRILLALFPFDNNYIRTSKHQTVYDPLPFTRSRFPLSHNLHI